MTKKSGKFSLNVFTVFILVTVMAFAFRIVNIFTFDTRATESVGAVKLADAEEKKPELAPGEEPPPLSKEDLNKAVQATAKEVEDTVAPPPVAHQNAPKAPAEPLAAGTPGAMNDDNRAFTSAEIDVLQSLSKRRDALDKRQKALDEREALLKAGEQEVDRKIAELNKTKGEIEKLLGQQEKMEEERISSLVKIYENMKPKEAATIFNTLDLDILISVVSRMNEKKLSPILASMDPEKARIVTIRLAEMRTLPSKGEKEEDALPLPLPPAQ